MVGRPYICANESVLIYYDSPPVTVRLKEWAEDRENFVFQSMTSNNNIKSCAYRLR